MRQLEPDDNSWGNRIDEPQQEELPAWRQKPKRFGRNFDPASLATADDCRRATVEIDEEIASIGGALEAFGVARIEERTPERLSWRWKASQALAHRKRIRLLIGQRHSEIIGNRAGTDPAEVQRMITERAKLNHEQKLERIRLSNSRDAMFRGALRKVVSERYGKAVWEELAIAAEAMVDAREADACQQG